MKPRYFKHKNGFVDGTKWIKCVSDKESIIVMDETSGRTDTSTIHFSLHKCNGYVKEGLWIEIKIAPYKLIIDLMVRIAREVLTTLKSC